MKKRILCILLICCMVLGLFPVSALAANSDVPFTDVRTTDWFYDEVCYAYEHGLMQGTSATTFHPNWTTSRGMIVTILYRLEGEPSFMNDNIFPDVVSDSWYEKAVVWANGKGIVKGYDNGNFGPNDPITREQLAAIMYRYADYKGYDTAAKADLSDFADSGKISSYALDAMKWANAAGLINGIGASQLDPQGDADRAQAAAILMRFCEAFVTEKTYTVTFDLNYGSNSTYTTQDVKDGEKVVQPAAPTRSGYTFVGWYKDTVGGSKFDFGTAVIADLTLYARWAKNGGDTPYIPPTPSYSDLKVTEAGSVDGGTYNNVTIDSAVGNGDVELKNVTIKGKLTVLGGGSNSVHLDACKVDTIEVKKEGGEAPRLDLKGTPVKKIEAAKPVIIEADTASTVKAVEAKSDVTVQGANTKVEKVTVPEAVANEGVKLTVDGAAVEKVTAEKPVTIEATSENSTINEVEAKSNVTVQGAATKVDNVTIPEGAAENVTLKVDGAKVKTVAAEKPVTIEATDGASPIEKVEAKDDLTVKGDAAQIEQVQVPNTATKQPVIDVQAGTVAEVKADKPAKVEGSGTVTNVTANAAVEVASATVTTITVTVAVTVTVTGTSKVEVAVTAPVSVNIAADETNSVAVSTTVSTGVSVQVNNAPVTHIHKWGTGNVTKAASCSEEGSVTYTCTGEGTCDTNTKTETLPKLAHKEVIDDAVAATCTETGLTAGKHCGECNAVLVEQKVTAALGHRFADAWSHDDINHWHAATCEHTDEKSDLATHIWDNGVVTKSPTGTQEGVKTFTCTVCSATKTEVIPATNTVVTTYDDFVAALSNDDVTGITVNADITVPAQGEWTVLSVSKPVYVADGKTLTVAGYQTDGEKFGFLANDLTLMEGGSLTLGENAKLKTTAFQSGEDEPFYNYTGRVCVSGGTLDVSAGTVAEGSFFNFNYVGQTLNSDALILGENKPEIEFAVHNDAQLRAAIADGKCNGGVILEDDITLEDDLSVAKLVNVNTDKTLTVPANKTLTVAENGFLQVSGTLNVYGTLTNRGQIFNLNFIDVLGGTLSNSGVINGNGWSEEDGSFSYASNIAIENGATINNFIGEKRGTINDRIAVSDYYREGQEVKQCHWYMLEDDHTFEPVFADGQDNPNFDVMAMGFGAEQVKSALNAMSYWGDETEQHSAYTYERVVACGTDPQNVNNVVLDGITVHPYGALILKDEVFDGTNIYKNKYVINEGNTLTLEKDSALVMIGKSELVINGNYIDNGADITLGEFTLSGKNAPHIVHSENELTEALKVGGMIILEGTEEFVKDTDDGNIIELKQHITVSKDTELVNQFGDILYIPGLTVAENATLTVSNMTVVLAADSTISGTLNIGENCTVMLRTPNEATGGKITELTVANGGKIVIGGEDESLWNARLGNAEGDNAGKLINNGTIESYGGLRIETYDENHYSGNGTVNKLNFIEVTTEDALLAALAKPYVTEIGISQSMTILGTKDENDHNSDFCFYLNNEGRNGDLNIYIYGEATLTVGSAEHTTKLDIGGGVKVTLIQIDAGYAKVVANKDSCINVFGELNVMGDWQHEDYYTGNINFFPDVMELGMRLLEYVEAYELPAMAEQELADNRKKANEWPDGDGRIDGFKLLVKHGGLEPITEEDDQGKDYIVWRPYDKITYGVAIDVLTNIYKAIVTEAEALPDSVALGDENWTPDPEHLINDHDLEELLNEFVDVLPKVTDSTTTNITLIRDNKNQGDTNLTNDGKTITGKTFTNPITIICDPQYLEGDDFGGELKFVNCDFAGGVTVKMTDGVNFRVDFGNSCTCAGNAVVTLPDGKTLQQCRDNRTNVELFYVSGMSFDTTTNNAFADFNDWRHDKTVSFTLNGLTITDEGEGAFNINARYDENGRDDNEQPIFIPTVEVTIFAKDNEVKVSGNYTGKLRISGNADVSELALSDGGFIEMSNSTWADIKLGNNTIFVNGDCDGEHSFTGTANSKVIVRDQNSNVQIKMNGVDLGTPHIFGEHGEMIFFPLANAAIGDNNPLTVNGKAVTFIVKQGDQTLNYDFEIKQDGSGVHLKPMNGAQWVTDPNNVCVTVTVGDCSVVYDTIMWKPITETEFAQKLNQMLGTSYTFESFELSDNYLTYGKASKLLSTAWKNYDNTMIDMPDLHEIIHDDNYWGQRDDWNQQHDAADDPEKWLKENEGWNPDNCTWDWFFANDVIGKLKSALEITTVD